MFYDNTHKKVSCIEEFVMKQALAQESLTHVAVGVSQSPPQLHADVGYDWCIEAWEVPREEA